MPDLRRALIIGSAEDRADVAGALAAAGYEVQEAEAAVDPPAFVDVVAVAGPDAGALVDALRGDSALATIRAKNAELDAFASRASHDLKTPLAVISGTADTLRKAWDRLKEPDREKLLEAMSTQATRAAAMVNDLLALARSDPAERAVPTTDPRAVAEEAVGRLPLTDADEVAFAGDWPAVTVPVSDLKSIFSNLADNAHHYGRGADGALRLTIGCTTEEGAVRITVDDAGDGVADEEVGALFSPGGRLEHSHVRNPHSTGMGLAIVRRCAERNGGTCGVAASPAGGARFWVTLPLPQQAG